MNLAKTIDALRKHKDWKKTPKTFREKVRKILGKSKDNYTRKDVSGVYGYLNEMRKHHKPLEMLPTIHQEKIYKILGYVKPVRKLNNKERRKIYREVFNAA